MENLPPSVELQQLDLALARVEAERVRLLTRRAQLLAVLRQAQPAPWPQGPANWAPPAAAPAPPGGRARRESRPPTVQNVLLSLGGVLLAVAVTAFTLVSWGHLGLGGRAAVLAALTLAALGVPALLLRRSLPATAEVVAGLGLVLLVLDAYALWRVALPTTDGVGYAAWAAAALAAVWGAYGLLLRPREAPPGAADSARDGGSPARTGTSAAQGAGQSAGAVPGPAQAPDGPADEHVTARGDGTTRPGLRLPLPVAIGIAQLPLLLWAAAASAGRFGFGAALLATAALDAVVVLRSHTSGIRLTAVVCALVTGPVGLLTALSLSATAESVGGAGQAAVLLLAAAAGLMLIAARRGAAASQPDGLAAASPSSEPQPPADSGAAGGWAVPEPWVAGAGGLAAVAAFGGLLRTGLPGAWPVLGYLLCGSALLASAWAVAGHRALAAARTPVALGLAGAAAVVHAAAVLWAVPAVAVAVLGPVSWAGAVWSGASGGARQAVGPDLSWPGTLTVPAVLGVVAAVLLAAHRHGTGRPWRTAVTCAAVLCPAAAAAVLPVSLDLPFPVAVGLLVAQIVVLLVASATLTPPAASRTALGCALAVSLTAAFWALAEQSVTFGVLGTLLVAYAATAWTTDRVRQSVAACAAVVCAVALAVAVPAAVDLPAHRTAFAVLAVAAAAALVAARARELPAGPPVECTGYAAVALAIGLATGEAPALATVLALSGVLATGTALRPDRRRAAALAATALFVLATWVRLAASDVGTPEAYALPVSAPALFIGLRRRHRDPGVSSWAAYGPGLSATLLPSLLAAWGDSHWPRPLLLGAAALALTLAGARHRLQAPLLLGGVVLALVAVHELAPYLVQVVGALPRWLPPALAGLLLLAVGATYEQRLGDARRLRDALGRMR